METRARRFVGLLHAYLMMTTLAIHDGEVLAASPHSWATNWEAARERWEQRGVTFRGSYTGEVLGNLSGGLRSGAIYEGAAELTLDMALERWIAGSRLHVRGILVHGESPTERLVSDLQGVSNLDAFRTEASFYELWWEHQFSDADLNLRFGLLLADEEFFGTDAGSLFIHSSFGWPASVSFNTRNTGPAFFRSALGLRLQWEPSPEWQFRIGAYDGDTFDGDPTRDSPMSFQINGEDGVFAAVEALRSWNVDSTTADGARAGRLRVGGWYHTGTLPSPSDPALDRAGGIFAGAEQVLVPRRTGAGPAPGLAVFGRAGWSPDQESVADWAGDLGLRLDGLLPARFEDALGIGVGWVHLSDAYRALERAATGGNVRSAEIVFELTWSFVVFQGLTLQPDYQCILALSEPGSGGTAQVLGLRARWSF